MLKRVLVTGATGKVGRHVVSQLAASAGVHVRALTRDPGAARLPAGVEVVRGDLTTPESLDAGLRGVAAVFLVWTAPAATADSVIERISRSARRIVFLSAPLKTPHPFFQQPNPVRASIERIESLIEGSGIEWTFLRPGMFAANALLWWAPQTRAGDVVRWPYLDAPTAPIDERDVAAVAVETLCRNMHAGKEYVLTGPESLMQREQILTIARATGRTLRVEEAQFPGLPRMLLDAWSAALGRPAYVSNTFREIMGSAPRTFLTWAIDHAAEF